MARMRFDLQDSQKVADIHYLGLGGLGLGEGGLGLGGNGDGCGLGYAAHIVIALSPCQSTLWCWIQSLTHAGTLVTSDEVSVQTW